uniref:Uncharacterized protein n=1 Tax=Geladintestivirus 2 TaxID=3233134 RepID=A0AAU8MI54_9CAUD
MENKLYSINLTISEARQLYKCNIPQRLKKEIEYTYGKEVLEFYPKFGDIITDGTRICMFLDYCNNKDERAGLTSFISLFDYNINSKLLFVSSVKENLCDFNYANKDEQELLKQMINDKVAITIK